MCEPVPLALQSSHRLSCPPPPPPYPPAHPHSHLHPSTLSQHMWLIAGVTLVEIPLLPTDFVDGSVDCDRVRPEGVVQRKVMDFKKQEDDCFVGSYNSGYGLEE
ncbi:hypothetical protein EGR_10991 [Echinococcus granulosus]|uniref:Uncharacterized protein n=1 Tax=Echinococcus granulosus TaxID=6210 RepID=W6U105_ECHGR|nr:hypothetical protein EGR_10991 [Echinococcus granulosus]EUB54146.1 hypothetical protein EGR_10991 [Echinococcus granulosus]